jgi:hypothetical protein
MTCPPAVEALTRQGDRLALLLRLIDNGRWWAGDDTCLIDEDEVCLQAERIRAALDVVERLTGEMAAENGTGPQLASSARSAVPTSKQLGSESCTVPEDLGPFSPGQVGPLHDEIHESGGYEQRARGLSRGVSKMA